MNLYGLHTKLLGRENNPPVYRLGQEVFSLDADVWVPLGENPRVLFKHPPVTSGHTAN